MNYKQLIVESGKRMAGSGLTVETWGNISFRDKETGLVYLTPSAMLYDTIVEDDVVVCKLDGTIVDGERKPTIETEMHLSVYRNREDVNAIIHTHPIYSMVYAAQGKDIPLIIDEAAQVMGDVCRCADYALPGSHELAENCVEALGEKANTCLIHSHGAVCVSVDMEGAFKTAKVLEVTAQIYYMIEAAGGKPAGISEENIKAMQDFVKNSYGQGK
ncbi:class II aldolase/adducin family protein [Lachnospiraceae bacterium 42-17]